MLSAFLASSWDKNLMQVCRYIPCVLSESTPHMVRATVASCSQIQIVAWLNTDVAHENR